MQKELIPYLESFITHRRKSLFDKIINYRTRYITVVLEDLYQSHNVSAVLRSCDCFGIQDIHIIENRNNYEVNPDIALGADKWLNLMSYKSHENSIRSIIHNLRLRGYRIVGTKPQGPNTKLQNFDLEKGPVALMFGTELEGLSEEIMNEAEEFMQIPMYGFTESLNISVSVAIILQFMTYRLHNSNIKWQLSEEEKNEIELTWLRRSIRNSSTIEKEFFTRNKANQ